MRIGAARGFSRADTHTDANVDSCHTWVLYIDLFPGDSWMQFWSPIGQAVRIKWSLHTHACAGSL